MCLILVAWRVREDFPLIVAANRDEFHDRPTAPADFWEERPGLLAGRDLKAGGTWLGVTRRGRWAALTNYRDPSAFRPAAPSRGRLVLDYLAGRATPPGYLRRIAAAADGYNGFNLLAGDRRSLCWFSNRGGGGVLAPGLYGLSNGLLDAPWPKVARGKEGLAALLVQPPAPSPEALLALLADRSLPPDGELPVTGVGLERERVLAPLFIAAPGYGTRSSTVLMVDRSGGVTFVERLFDSRPDPWMTARFAFRLCGG